MCTRVNNVLCELPYTPPPPDLPLVDKKLAMKYSEDTSSCPGLPKPSNTRLENMLTASAGTAYSNKNWFLACRKPKSSDGIKNVISNIDTRTIPAGTEGIILNFHYFCGEFKLCILPHSALSELSTQLEILTILSLQDRATEWHYFPNSYPPVPFH